MSSTLSIPDIRDSFRTHVHLCAIGLQPLHSFINDYEVSSLPQSEAAALPACDEIYQQLMAYLPAQISTGCTLLADSAVDFDINTVFTKILAHSSIITLYQRFVNARNLNPDSPPHVAVQRCMQACEEIVMVIRNLGDSDAKLNAPGLASRIYDAARFKLAVYRATGQPREPSFDTLMHGLNMCTRRWPMARRLDIVLRTATLISRRKLKEWIQNFKPFLHARVLNGLYAYPETA